MMEVDSVSSSCQISKSIGRVQAARVGYDVLSRDWRVYNYGVACP